MKLVIRKYTGSGAKELFDIIAHNMDSLNKTMESIPGLDTYSAALTENGGITITVCQDENGIRESIKRAKDWVAEHAGKVQVEVPQIMYGDLL